MDESKASPPASDQEHADRVHDAFETFQSEVAEKTDDAARERLERMRNAAIRKDAGEVREHLSFFEEANGWLYKKMTGHPKLATLIDELALWGF